MMYLYLLIGLLSFLLEVGLLPALFPSINIPELLLPLIIVLALLKGERESISIALIFGLLKDTYFYTAFGLRTFLFFLVALILSQNRNKFARKGVFVISLLTIIISVLYMLLYAFGLSLLSVPMKSHALLSGIFSLEIPIQILAGLIYYRIVNKPRKRRLKF